MPDQFAALAEASQSANVDAEGLATALRAQIGGEVRFDNSARALYATDGSNYRQVPIGVVLPRNDEDVLAALALCREYGAPLLCRGAGTSLAGQCCNVAVILDFSKYMAKILEIDPVRRIARVQPGVVLDNLRAAAEKHHLTFGPDPASHDRCTLGGMIGNNSCGTHSIMAGKTDDNIEELEILLYDGTRLKVGQDRIEPCGDSRPRLSSGRRPAPLRRSRSLQLFILRLCRLQQRQSRARISEFPRHLPMRPRILQRYAPRSSAKPAQQINDQENHQDRSQPDSGSAAITPPAMAVKSSTAPQNQHQNNNQDQHFGPSFRFVLQVTTEALRKASTSAQA